MKGGDLVRLDVGCESERYSGDLGRTVPVSGRFTAEQREIWNSFVAAYRAGVQSIREGATEDQVFAAWSAELGQGTAWQYYSATMGDLISSLKIISNRRSVYDKTGLTGNYDFTFQQIR